MDANSLITWDNEKMLSISSSSWSRILSAGGQEAILLTLPSLRKPQSRQNPFETNDDISPIHDKSRINNLNTKGNPNGQIGTYLGGGPPNDCKIPISNIGTY